MARVRRVETVKEMERVMDDLITCGYKVKSQGEFNANLIKRGQKTHHVLVFFLTFWFTFGIGNLIYALMPGKIEDEVMIKVESAI